MLIKKVRHGGVLVAVLMLLAGCGLKYKPIDLEGHKYPDLEKTPFFPQEKYQCGPAALASLLVSSGTSVEPDELVPLVYVPKRQGSFQVELIAAARTYGRIPYILEPNINALAAELIAGRPVLVLQNYGLNMLPSYHFAVVIGLLPNERIILRSGTTKRHIMKISHFLMSWLRPGAWAMVVLRPGELPENINFKRYLQAVSAFEVINSPLAVFPAYQAALARWPENALLLFALGNNALQRDDPDEAIGYYRQVLGVDSQHLGAINNLADTLAKKGCLKEAKDLIEKGADIANQQSSIFIDAINDTRKEIEKLAADAIGATNGPACK